MVAETHLNIPLYMRCLSCYFNVRYIFQPFISRVILLIPLQQVFGVARTLRTATVT